MANEISKTSEGVVTDMAQDHNSSPKLTQADTNHEHTDIGLSYYRKALEIEPALRDSIALRVRRKIDFTLLPAVSVAGLDQQTIIDIN
jgi:hypothetical protein